MNDYDMTMSLLKYFAGPRVKSLSLLLPYWPMRTSVRRILSDLPNLFPNVTSFSAFLRALTDHIIAVPNLGGIAKRWPHLQSFRVSPYSAPAFVELISIPTLTSLHVPIDYYTVGKSIGKLSNWIQEFSLDACDVEHCLGYLRGLKGSPRCLHLRMKALPSDSEHLDRLIQVLPTQFDVTQLHCLEIELTVSHLQCGPLPSMLAEPVLQHLYLFAALRRLDMRSFCTSSLDDAAYARMAASWPELRSLKMGTTDVNKEIKPAASVGAVIALLKFCPHLHTLHIVFNGSIPPPHQTLMPYTAKDGKSVRGEDVGAEEGKWEKRAAMRQNRWGISNWHITQIHVGHSPLAKNVDGYKDLMSCLRSVMPRLKSIQPDKKPFDVAERRQMKTNPVYIRSGRCCTCI